MMRRLGIIVLLLPVMLATGCGSKGGNPPGMRVLPRPKPPPPAPPRQAAAVDPALRAAAAKELVALYSANDPLLRVQTVEAMQESGEAQFADEIILALGDERAPVRFAAAMAAGQVRLKEAKPALANLVDDLDLAVQVAARFALHRLGDMSRTHDLERTARDTDPYVRRVTAMALGLLGEKSAIKILRRMRLDPDPGVRQQAVGAMWRLGNEEALNQLVGLTVSQYVDDQMEGLTALAAPGLSTVREHVRGKLTSDYTEVSLVAARAMGMLNSDEGMGVALQGAKSKDPNQRFLAARALAAIGRADAQPVLAALLKDNNPHVRLAAASALLQLGA